MKYTDEFPVVGTKIDGLTKEFDLSTPEGRAEYFEEKAGEEINKLKGYFKDNTFIAYMLAKKSAGKGTYTKLMKEIFGDVIAHASVGDAVRAAHIAVESGGDEKKKIEDFLRTRYRGYISLEEALGALLGRTQQKLLPDEFILALLEYEIDKLPRKTLFIDGLPRNLDQISYALFFRSLIDYRQDPDVFVAIDIPESVIDERMQGRVVCPTCQVPRNTKLLITKSIGFDTETGEFHLLCDDHGEKMIPKEGDAAGIESIRERLNKDQELIDKMFSLHGVPKIFLRNAIPADSVEKYFDKYELTPMYSYSWNERAKKVEVNETPWTILDDEGVEVHSLLAPPVVISFIKQLVVALGL